MTRKTSDTLPNFEYFIKGENPKLLIHSGTHGDEYEVADVVRKCVEKYEDRLPDFLYVPIVSPSAVKSKTRFNENNLDMNRIFFASSTEPEVVENIKAMNGFNFDLFVTFHEDPLSDEYYIYDSGTNKNEDEKIKKHNQTLNKLGIKLLNGVDDPEDPDLGYEFKEGYKKFVEKVGEDSNSGMINTWVIEHKKVIQTLVPEIPGILPMDKKTLIVESFFESILLQDTNS